MTRLACDVHSYTRLICPLVWLECCVGLNGPLISVSSWPIMLIRPCHVRSVDRFDLKRGLPERLGLRCIYQSKCVTIILQCDWHLVVRLECCKPIDRSLRSLYIMLAISQEVTYPILFRVWIDTFQISHVHFLFPVRAWLGQDPAPLHSKIPLVLMPSCPNRPCPAHES